MTNNDQNTEAREALNNIQSFCDGHHLDQGIDSQIEIISAYIKAQAESEGMCGLRELLEVAARHHKDHRKYADEHEDKETINSLHHGAANAYEVMEGLIEEKLTEQREAGWRPLCHSIDFGTYDNAVAIQAPWGELITLDICVIPEIKWLWDNGVRTTGSCCGHGDRSLAVICADDNSQSKMEKLGYKPHPKAPHCYISKTAPPPAEESE